jgi:DNA-binding MarR family transcriptional regulator
MPNMNKGYHPEILRSIRQIIRAIDIDSWRLATEHKVTGPHFPSPMVVVGNGVTMAVDVAKHVHFGPSTLLCIADCLEIKGLVRPERNSRDRR